MIGILGCLCLAFLETSFLETRNFPFHKTAAHHRILTNQSTTSTMTTTTIAVSGASGHLGSAIVKELAAKRAAGAHIRVVAVSRSAASKPIADADESRFGDANDRASLDKAYAGVDRIVIVISSDLEPGVRAKQVKTAIDAAVAAHIKHIVIFGLLSARKVELGNLVFEYYESEQHLIKTVPNDGWTVLRMAYFAESLSNTFLTPDGNAVGYSLDKRINIVSRDDLAAAAAAVLTSDGHKGAIYNITGPQAFTLPELAAAGAKVTGKPAVAHATTSEKHRATLAGFNLPPLVVNLVDSIFKSHSEGFFDVTTGDVERLTGRKPHSFESVYARAQQQKH
jgi:NAD(P)H dehydrogenase (quinone)